MISTSSLLRRAAAITSAAAMAAALGAISPAIAAAADYQYLPPVVSFETGDSSITATIHNPNERGICFLTIGIGDGDGGVDDHSWSNHIFTDDHATAWPGPGETLTVTHEGLRPWNYGVTGVCSLATTGLRGASAEYEVRVGPEPIYRPSAPEVVFETGESSITAKVGNRNDRGVCYLTIALDDTGAPDSTIHPGQVFGPGNVQWPGPGEIVTVTHTDLRPGNYYITGECASVVPRPEGEPPSTASEYVVTVEKPVAPPAGPSASLGSIFGSLSL